MDGTEVFVHHVSRKEPFNEINPAAGFKSTKGSNFLHSE